MLTDFNKTEPDEEMDDAAQRQTALKKLVKIVVKSFYEPVELMIVDLIIRENCELFKIFYLSPCWVCHYS